MALTQQFASGEDLTAAKLNASSIPVVSSTADITTPFTGQIVFNTTDTRLYRYTGSAWRKFSGGPVWSLARNTTQSITVAATHQDVLWNQEDVDTDGVHSLVSNTDRVTITQDGLYGIAARTSFTGGDVSTASLSRRASRITLNGSEVTGGLVVAVAAASTFSTTVVIPTLYLQLVVGDILRCSLWAGGLGAGCTSAAGSVGDYPVFTGTWLRD